MNGSEKPVASCAHSAARCEGSGGSVRSSSVCSGAGPRQPRLQALHRQIDHRRRVERQQLAEQQPADDGDAERIAQLRAGAAFERERDGAEQAASVVIMIGRNRSSEAWTMDSRGESPCLRSASSAKSIIMMAFFLTMPISSTMPISATTERS